ncbi:hypothetical protein ACN4EG_18450 [Alkalinema pantanalense CENA528]|uniref:hypothetical protein n=1 Tax=Alkalinema pantanalense TaxID=1620705 RepID=UPI003D6DD4AC
MDFTDQENTLVCVGQFDPSGLPIMTSRHLSQYATVAFQVISLKTLLERSLPSENLQTAYIHHEDGSSIKIERSRDGFVAYLIPNENY